MTRYKPIGWRNDNYRHSLAARGIRTSFFVTGIPGGTKGPVGKRQFEIPHKSVSEKIAHEKSIVVSLESDPELMKDPATRNRVENSKERIKYLEKVKEVEGDVRGSFSSRRQAMYVPTYVAADMPLIAGDAIGTAGAATVGLIPLVVGAGVVYGGAKYVKKESQKYKTKKKKRVNK